jgi:hypothetical protein
VGANQIAGLGRLTPWPARDWFQGGPALEGECGYSLKFRYSLFTPLCRPGPLAANQI